MIETQKRTMESPSSGSVSAKTIKFVHNFGDTPTYHADGAWGTNNQHATIKIAFYTENPSMPDAVIQPVKPDGTPDGMPQFEGLDNPDYYLVSRDFQCNVVLPLTAAVQVHQILGNFIEVTRQEMAAQVESIKSQLASHSTP